MRRNRLAVLLAAPLLLVAACAPAKESASPPAGSATAAKCAKASLPLKTPGKLTIGTDSPAYDPWFSHNDPSNGKGFESAVAYAVAHQLGFTKKQVTWVKVPFNNSYAPGAKSFDFDINQISITPQRAKVVDFSTGYYSAAQAVIALKGSPTAKATSLADLKSKKLGAQTGTTSLEAINDIIKPTQQPLVFDDTNAAKQALLNKQVDGIVADLPTAFYITAVQIPQGTIVGQFQPVKGHTEQFGMLFQKGSGLVACVDKALVTMKENGELAAIQKRWLSQVVNVPVLH
jgi:polar amino acid transport system substrate-binding protein